MTTKTTATRAVGLPRASTVAATLTFIAFPGVTTLPFAAATTTAALALTALPALATLPALVPAAAGWAAGLIRSLGCAGTTRGALTIVGRFLGRGLTG